MCGTSIDLTLSSSPLISYGIKSRRVSDTFKTFNNKNKVKKENIYALNSKSKIDRAI